MDDELEDKVLYQTYVSHMKLLSKFAFGVSSVNSPLSYMWKLLRLYLPRPEIILCGIIIFIFLIYVQALDVWSRGFLGRIKATLGYAKQSSKLKIPEASSWDFKHWEVIKSASGVYALLGRRPRMEDRFVIEENVNDTGISLFAIFDGHGGEFAADFAKDILIKNIFDKIVDTINLLNSDPEKLKYDSSSSTKCKSNRKDNFPVSNSMNNNKENESNQASDTKKNVGIHRRDSFKTSLRHSTLDDCATTKINNAANEITDIFSRKLNSLIRPVAKDSISNSNHNNNAGHNGKANNKIPQTFDAKCYVENGKINFGKMITDEILSADYKLVEVAKKSINIAGTTALIAIIQDTKLIVANVGDSRAVMCDSKGNAIPLSFDHKPQQVRERKRIHDAGGFIAFRGVWRVAGILATSRALGDYPLKDKNLVIANPDILTFELSDHKPSFLILASDGLWDTFSNEEAVAFIKDHLNEPTFGAKSLALQSYIRGSVDNITVIVIKFEDGNYRIGSSLYSNASSNNNS